MNIEFKGKTVIVTGGSRGIGASISALFASCGANVMIGYLPVDKDIEGLRQVEHEIREKGGVVDSIAADVTSPEAMEELVAKTLDRFGGLEILVNSAGFTKPVKVQNLSTDLWKSGIDVNLNGAYYITKAACKQMTMQGSGRIIYIGSAGSITGGGGSAAYSAAKAGINGLVRALSKELAPQGITVNAVLPALIETDLLKEREPDPEKRNKYIKRIPVGRFGTPLDVAYTVLFLASEYAGFITGQNIIVDGGSTYK
ncbi:MAG: SDR family oxidoreductase [Anaerolineae bacterium]|jgi:3-oxoacyl-[acyl-carrier protein] reductase|nr:SDR family oxidoreductase [Anaerolineae bacterium]